MYLFTLMRSDGTTYNDIFNGSRVEGVLYFTAELSTVMNIIALSRPEYDELLDAWGER